MNEYKSIKVRPQTKKRFNSLKALTDDNADEFLNQLLDKYESEKL